jgi:hypothetical protein
LRREITERAYREIVKSGKYTYRSFVNFVLEQSLAGRAAEQASLSLSVWTRLVYYWMRLSEVVSWVQVALHLHSFVPRLKGIVRRLLLGVFSEQTVVSMLGRVKPNKRETD